MIITLKGLKEIYSKIKDNHARRLELKSGELYGMSNNEKADYVDVEYLLSDKINTYEEIQKLTDELIRIQFKPKEVEIISKYMYFMDK